VWLWQRFPLRFPAEVITKLDVAHQASSNCWQSSLRHHNQNYGVNIAGHFPSAVQRARQRRVAEFCSTALAFVKRQRNGCANVRELISAPFSTPAFFKRHRNRSPALGSHFCSLLNAGVL